MKRRVDGPQSHLGRCVDEKNRRTGSSLWAAWLHPFQKFGAKLKSNVWIKVLFGVLTKAFIHVFNFSKISGKTGSLQPLMDESALECNFYCCQELSSATIRNRTAIRLSSRPPSSVGVCYELSTRPVVWPRITVCVIFHYGRPKSLRYIQNIDYTVQ